MYFCPLSTRCSKDIRKSASCSTPERIFRLYAWGDVGRRKAGSSTSNGIRKDCRRFRCTLARTGNKTFSLPHSVSGEGFQGRKTSRCGSMDPRVALHRRRLLRCKRIISSANHLIDKTRQGDPGGLADSLHRKL